MGLSKGFLTMKMPSARVALSTLVFSALTLVLGTSCKEEETKLFDEEGVWALESYALDGLTFTQIDQVRKNTFLLRFSPGDGVVAAANCFASGSSTSVNEATCTINKNSAEWECRCYAYEFTDSTMVWQEFAPGETPPPVGNPTNNDSGGSDEAGDEGGDGGGAHQITIEETDSSGTYRYVNLPEGLFDSDGMTSKHVFRIKADSVWTGADIDEDEVNDLDECSMSCFPSMAGG